MAAIRSRDTKPEILLRAALRKAGLRGYRCNLKALAGKPDVAFTRWKVAVFVDGCFWHGHPDHFEFGRFGSYWDEKIKRTQERDRLHQASLESEGFEVIRFWDFDVIEDPEVCARRVLSAVERRRRKRSSRPGTG